MKLQNSIKWNSKHLRCLLAARAQIPLISHRFWVSTSAKWITTRANGRLRSIQFLWSFSLVNLLMNSILWITFFVNFCFSLPKTKRKSRFAPTIDCVGHFMQNETFKYFFCWVFDFFSFALLSVCTSFTCALLFLPFFCTSIVVCPRVRCMCVHRRFCFDRDRSNVALVLLVSLLFAFIDKS